MKHFTIFHVDAETGLRSGERQLVYLACALRERGHQNVVVCRWGSDLSKFAAARKLDVRTLPFCCDWDPYTALRLRLWARKAKNAVLHAHARLPGAAGRFPLVLDCRTDSNLDIGRAARVVAVSKALRTTLIDAGIASEKVSVVSEGIPADADESRWACVKPHEFAPPSWEARDSYRKKLAKEFNIDYKVPWIGTLGTAVTQKEQDIFIAAALIAMMKRPDAIFLIAGAGTDDERLFTQIRRMGLLGRVLLVGRRDDEVAWLKCLDVFAPSSWVEGMGGILLEAVACGVPIAATTAGGTPEIVTHRDNGLLSPPRDAEGLAQNITTLIEDQKFARQLALKGIKGLPRFGLARMAEEMEKIYEAVS